MSTQTLDSQPLPGDSGSPAKDVADRDQEIGEDELDEMSGKRKRKAIEKDAEGEEEEEVSGEKKDDIEEDGTVVKKVRKRRSVSRVPATSIDRPSRARKTVERYSASTPTPKSVPIKRGHGTKLREIPNVFFKLSKRKADENLQHLHRILYGKKAKVRTLKRSILDFSGFVWTSNEDREKLKLREKLDRCVKDKLFDFCDMFDIHVAKATTRKEDILTLLLDFLQSPHVTRDVLLEEKEKTGQKRKWKARESVEKKSGEIRQRKKGHIIDEKPQDEEPQDEETQDEETQDEETQSEENVEKNEENDVDGHDSVSKDTVLEKAVDLDKSESKEKHLESDPDTVQQQSSPKEVSKGGRSNEENENSKSKVNTSKRNRQNSKASSSKKSTPTKKAYVSRAVSKSKDDKSKSQENMNASNKNNNVNKKQVTEVKSQLKYSRGRKGNGSGKKATGKSEVSEPSSEELRSAVSDILKEVDFNVATLSDILKQLATQFGTDLTHKKSEIKGIIEDVVSNMTDAESESGEEEVEETTDRG